MKLTLHPPDETGAWRIELTDPPPQLPPTLWLARDAAEARIAAKLQAWAAGWARARCRRV